MAIEKVGVYRKWLEPVPKRNGNPIPKSEWPRRRRYCWIVRWCGANRKKYGKLFTTRKEAQRYASELQNRVCLGKTDKPKKITLHEFRLEKIRERQKVGDWNSRCQVVNNLDRNFRLLRGKAGVDECVIHDLRRSAITNWAKKLPIQVVQQLAGHSDISTTRKYYLAVRSEDLASANSFLNKVLTEVRTN